MSSLEEVIFFFGAGASVKAGVKDTYGLVDEFRKYLSSSTKLLSLLDQILQTLKNSSTKIDIEALMQTLDRLESRDSDNLLKFYSSQNFKLNDANLLPALTAELKKFINISTSVKSKNVAYLEPLLSYPELVKIFSVNYDTAVEQFCNVYKREYTDGFESKWDPTLFTKNNFKFHLYKLHGSITWYKTDHEEYMKLLLPPKNSEVRLIFGEKAHHLMLYPMQKWEFVEPLLEILSEFKKQLEKTTFVVVVGYSFRDPHILRLFHEAARKNPNLIIILIGPESRTIYEEKLQYYSTDSNIKNKIPSSLKDRVLCLQHKFEDIFPLLRLEILPKLRNGIRLEKEAYDELYAGSEPQWLEGPIAQYVEAEFLDKVNTLSNRLHWFHEVTYNPVLYSLSALKAFVIAEDQKNESANYWLNLFLRSFSIIGSSAFFHINLYSNGYNFSFDISKRKNYQVSELQSDIQKVLEFYRKRRFGSNKLSFIIYRKMSQFNEYLHRHNRMLDYSHPPEFNKNASWKSKYEKALKAFRGDSQDNTIQQRLRDLIISAENKEISAIFGAEYLHDYIKMIAPERIFKSRKFINF